MSDIPPESPEEPETAQHRSDVSLLAEVVGELRSEVAASRMALAANTAEMERWRADFAVVQNERRRIERSRSRRRAVIAGACVLALLIVGGVLEANNTSGKVQKAERADAISNCQNLATITTAVRGVLDQIVGGAQLAVASAQATVNRVMASATASVASQQSAQAALTQAQQGLTGTRTFVAFAEAKLPVPDCTKLPQP